MIRSVVRLSCCDRCASSTSSRSQKISSDTSFISSSLSNRVHHHSCRTKPRHQPSVLLLPHGPSSWLAPIERQTGERTAHQSCFSQGAAGHLAKATWDVQDLPFPAVPF